MAWALAFVFEAAVFAFTHRVKDKIEHAHRLRQKEGENRISFGWRRFSSGYINVFSAGLLLSSGVSGLANFAYSVEFSQPFMVYADYSFPPLLYQMSFGGILPVVSFLFARILAEAIDTETERDEALVLSQKAERAAKRELAIVQNELKEVRLMFAQYDKLFADTKRERVLAARELWPTLQASGVAIIADASPGYVSDVLSSRGENGSSSE